MTIRALAETGRLGAPDEGAVPAPPGGADTTLAFSFDYGYLQYFKVMLRSMYDSGSYIDAPITLYSDDPQVLGDDFVQACVDRAVPIEGEKKRILHALAQNSVERPERAAWNRGTFLKWMVFEPHDTPKLLFLDVDMLCLDDLSEIERDWGGKPFACVPQFQRDVKFGPERKHRAPEIEANLTRLIDGDFWGGHAVRVNSGVMLLSGEVLDDAFFKEITGYAARHVEINEQSHFSKYFTTEPRLREFLSARYNFQESFVADLRPRTQNSLLERVAVLHYAGGVKPWSDREGAHRHAMQPWHKTHRKLRQVATGPRP